ncbi:transmembrane protein 247 isoform X1 [Chrysemys picta bellii]|uniref:transmembrane protein 247 isoform X1 n=2 Tax=Chrysemys picta bellii TaxID=8478 RepID=UPI0032B25014
MFSLVSSTTFVPESTMHTPGDTLTSSEVSHVETESLHVKDQETQADLERLSNLEGSEYSDQAGTALKEMQTGFEFTVQIAQYKDNKKQRQHEKMDASRGTPTSSYIPDDMTEGLDGKSQAAHLENRAKREADALQPEGFTSMGEISNLEELEQPCGRRITATDLELEKMRWDSALTRLKHKHEDNEKQRQHEKTMEQIRQQATPRSLGQGLHDLLQPQNQYTLFLYCFIFIHLIYTVRELAFYFVIKHYLFCFAIVLYFIFKKIFQDCKNKKKCC